MELACRQRGDQLLRPGELIDIRRRLRAVAPDHDLATVIACAFDHRTRMLPFIFADTRMAPAGVRAIGSAMVDSGFEKTRIVLQQWNPRFRPSQMRLDGRIPDLFMVSSMGMHLDRCRDLIRDACRIDPDRRPLILAGGPLAIYQPYQVFSADPADPTSADVAVTGEEYVLLNLLEVLLAVRARGESMRSAFLRARDSGALNEIPGLVYPQGDRGGVPEQLVDTGVQRLVGDLDELPDPIPGYRLLESPSRQPTLAARALPADRVHRFSPLSCVVMTFGCKFNCPYCPTPAYNQRQYRAKSGARIAEEMGRLNAEYGLRYFFAADDNFFNSPPRALEIIQALNSAVMNGRSVRKKVRWAAEVTVQGALQMQEHLPLLRRAGCRALWLGVEDMTGSLVQKGQSVDKTTAAFASLREAGILPMPMMMHHDDQPLYTNKGHAGLLNQVRTLHKAGAGSLQVLMITPAPGSRLYEEAFTSGQAFEAVGGKPVVPHMIDGNFVVASNHPQPWRKQLNLLIAYAYFYNPWHLLLTMRCDRRKVGLKPAGMQAIGMLGLMCTVRRTFGWLVRLGFGRIRRSTRAPASPIPIRQTEDACTAGAACRQNEAVAAEKD